MMSINNKESFDNLSQEPRFNFEKEKSKNEYNLKLNYIKKIFQNNYNLLNLPKKEVFKNIKDKNEKLFKNEILKLEKNDIEKIYDILENNQIDIHIFLFSIFGIIMSKYSKQESIYTTFVNDNIIYHNQDNSVFNIEPYLFLFNDNSSLNDIINQVVNDLKVYRNYYIPFIELKKEINLLNSNNLFIYKKNKLFNENDRNINENDIYGLESNIYDEDFDFIFKVEEKEEDQLVITIDYNNDIYDNYLIKSILKSFVEIATTPENIDRNASISEIEYINEEEKNRIFFEFNDNYFIDEKSRIFNIEFEKICKVYQDKVAVIFENNFINFNQLNKMSNSLANYLRNQGIKRNEIIPIISERSYYFIVAALAVLKAGGAFLPIDPEFPEDRIKFMINEVKAKLILKYVPNLKINNTFHESYCFEYELQNHNFEKNTENIENINDANDLAYVMFTSGTTGKPKGVLIRHSNLTNFCLYGLTYRRTHDYFKDYNSILSIAKFTYTICISDIFYPLLNHKIIVLCNNAESTNPALLGELISKYHANVMSSTPSRITNYLNVESFRKAISNIKGFIFGGELITTEFIALINKYSDAKIYCGYGLTEVVSMCTIMNIRQDNLIQSKMLIGKPCCNTEIFILDKYLKPVPIGVVGEIYISGNNVGSGYLNQKKQTDERFIDCPFNINNYRGKMYKTGDLGKWTNDGNIIYLGRIDFQIKVRGQRIELEEIENTVYEIKSIKFNTVLNKVNDKGEKFLVGYYICHDKFNINGRQIRNYLQKKLPMHMVPNYFIRIETIPLNSNGKLDRRKLPEPKLNDLLVENYVAPETDTEKVLCRIYSEIFNIKEENIGRMTDYYELGGNSLNAIKILSKIQQNLKIKINIKDILKKPFIHELAKYIDDNFEKETLNTKNDIIKKLFKKEFPITSQQLGVYIDSIKDNNSIIYNNPKCLKLSCTADINKIKKVFEKIFWEEEILRSCYKEKEVNNETKIYGIIDDNCELNFEMYTYSNASLFVRPFDLSKAPLIRVGFIEKDVLMVDTHHMITDGTSLGIIGKKFNYYYNNYETLKENYTCANNLDTDINFIDYANYLEEKRKNGDFDKEIKFYKDMFNCDYEIVKIPEIKQDMKLIREKNTISINTVSRLIDTHTFNKIKNYINHNGISETAFFFSIYAFILSKYSGNEKVYSSIVCSNRYNYLIENLVGMFVSTQPILLSFDNKDKTFLEFIQETMIKLLNVYSNQDISMSKLTNLLKLKKVNNNFIFQPYSFYDLSSMFKESDIFLNEYDYNEVNNLFRSTNELFNNQSKFNITFTVYEKKENYKIFIDYNNNIYDEHIINKFINSYIEVINNFEYFNQNIKEIQYIPSEERNKILYEFNDNQFEYEQNKLYHVEFSKVAKANANKCAIICNDIKFSYKEIDEMSNSLAHLLRSKNIQKNDIIPIISERSQHYVIGTLGIMKSGGAFLPIDPDFPEERINFILSEVKAKIILYFITNEENKNKIKFKINENIEKYDLNLHNYNENRNEIQNINESNDTCLVLFTSGTTGKPKGSLLSHNGVINYCLYCFKYKGKDDFFGNEYDNVLAFSKFTFDMFITEIFYNLLRGKKIILSNEDEFNNPELLSSLIVKNDIKFINVVPSRFENYMKNEKFAESLKNVKFIIFGGEKLSYNLINMVKKYSCLKIINSYGPAETTVICTGLIINSSYKESVVGKPLCNCNIYILDKNLNPVPIGVTGEIYISGLCVGKGYLNRNDLTNKSFIECPFISNNRKQMKMYKSGDLGRWTEDGEIECLGRIDFQVKIRGQRIELNEIENTIRELNGIDYCVVLDKINNENNNDKYLIAYYMSKNINITSKVIREFLKKKLPSYMIPNYFIKIDNIPFNNNGKLDRNVLPEPNIDEIMEGEYVEPETKIEKEI
eukprot:jgi/Orpsp1_1/1191401/evm.model.d7180000085497.1